MERQATAEAGPVPRVAFCLSVGITGHRTLNGESAALGERIAAMLESLRDAAGRLHASETAAFAATALAPRLISGLAEGADQLAAGGALALGYALHAVLPFEREEYAGDFTDPAVLAAFSGLLGRAERVFELPSRHRDRAAYGLAGRAMVAHCDVLIGVWDGLPARGPGGTAEVIEFAARRGVPVIHIATDPAVEPRLIWSAHNPHLTTSRLEDFASRSTDGETFDSILRQRLGPPDDVVERNLLATFYAEGEHRFRPRLEYPLLSAATGATRLRRSAVWTPGYLASAAAEWAPFRAAATTLIDGTLPLDAIEHSYAWSDRLAGYYAQTYRSGHVFNFAIGAVAVLLALSGLLAPPIKLYLAMTEVLAIAAMVVNTRVGTARNWHRRWLDYRQLAERLRPMRSLALIGLAQPGLEAAKRGSRSWVDWYAAGVWRSAGIPTGRMTATPHQIAARVLAEDIDPQIAYHHASAHAIAHLDHRLHRAGVALFALTCVGTLTFIGLYLTVHEWTVHHAAFFVALSAGLPAIGTALFGIRVQGDFAGTAARSLVTAEHLEAIAVTLRDPACSLSRAADAAEAAARAMLADLGEWRLSHQQRQLEVG